MTCWAGRWRVEAVAPDGVESYDGIIDIAARGEAFVLRWDISAGVYFGVGAPARGFLFVSCAPFNTGNALMVVDGARARLHANGDAPQALADFRLPAAAGFSFGPARIDGAMQDALCYRDADCGAAAWGRDIDRHVLLACAPADNGRLAARWTLGRSTLIGSESLKRL